MRNLLPAQNEVFNSFSQSAKNDLMPKPLPSVRGNSNNLYDNLILKAKQNEVAPKTDVPVNEPSNGLQQQWQDLNKQVEDLLNNEPKGINIQRNKEWYKTVNEAIRQRDAVGEQLNQMGNDVNQQGISQVANNTQASQPNLIPNVSPKPTPQVSVPTLKPKTMNDFTPTESPLVQVPGVLNESTVKTANLSDIIQGDITPESIAKAYNNKQWYHGTGTSNLSKENLDPLAGNHEGLFGNGVYMTDNPEIANGYAKSRGKRTSAPTIYDAKVNMNRVLDLEKPIPDDAKVAIDKFTKSLDYQYNREFGEDGYFSKIADELAAKGATTEEIIQRLRNEVTDFSHEAGISTSEFVENFQDLAINLKSQGYDGITHTGGGRTGHDPHRVLIALDPNDLYAQTGRTGQITDFKPHNPANLLESIRSQKWNSIKGNPDTSSLDEALNFLSQDNAKTVVKPNTVDYKTLEDSFVQDQLRPHYEYQKQAAEAETKWQTIVTAAKDEIERIKQSFGSIYVPKEAMEDYPLPKQFLAGSKDKHSDDIFTFADQMGFSSPDEAVQYLKALDEESKTKLKDLLPNGQNMISERDLRYKEEALRKEFRAKNIQSEPKQPAQTAAETTSKVEQLPKQEPVQGELPKESKKPNERSFFNTVQNPDKLSPELKQKLEAFDKTYKPMSNQELVDYANEYVKNDIEKAYQFVKNANKFDPRHIAVGHRLIDELQKAGQYDKALDVVERLAEQGTKAGQSIQSYSIYNRLTAEGQLLRAQRHVNRINETISDPAKQVKLTENNIKDITEAADSIQRMNGQMDQANNVIKIMDSLKKGKMATDAELETVRSFVSDAKKFVGDFDPKAAPPKVKAVKDVRTRDKVVDYMSKREELAKQELKKILGRANSMPVDALYHLSTIGASKIAKGTVKLADFTEEMVKDFGEMVRPYAKQIYNKAVETFNLQSESMTQKRLSEVEKITNKALKDKNLSADEVDTIKEFARKVGLMSGDAKLEASMELQTTLQLLERPTFGQKVSTAQTIMQLLNSKTIVRNAIGNELFYRVEQMNKLLATPIDIARSKITGGERTISFVRNKQGQYWRNWLTGAKAGWKGVNPMGLQTQYDLGPQAFRSKWNPLTYLEKSLGASLRSFDHAGYMRAYTGTLEEMAKLRAINEGLTGQAKKEAIQQYIREADENALQIADEYGKYATFQDNTLLSTALTKVKKGMNKVSTFGATENFGLGDMVLKYPKTPGNIVMRAIEYSPAGVIRSMHLLKDMATKNPKATREFYLSLSRAIIGTGGFSVLGYALANKGILTSAGNSDYEVASLERNAGKQPNSVNITALKRFITSGFDLDHAETQEGDTFVSYDWAQPISIAVALGTGVNQSVKENGELTPTGAVKGAFDSGANTVINQSVLKGLNDFLANYPGRTTSDRIGDAAKGVVGSFVPTLSNQARQLNDNTARTTYSPNLLPEIKNRAINRLPGAEKSLPPAYDTLGNKRQTYQSGGNNLFHVLLNPSFVSKYKPSPEAKMVLDVINATGDKTLAPRMAQKKIDGQPLTTEQYAEYQRIMGEQVRKRLVYLQESGITNNEVLAKAIDKTLRDSGKIAKAQLRQEMGD
jgi:hypothetical protein